MTRTLPLQLEALKQILLCRPLDTANTVDLWLNRGAIEDMARAAIAQAEKGD